MTDIQFSAQRINELTQTVLKKYPHIPHVTAVVLAGDMESAERMEEKVKTGQLDAYTASTFVGSFARMDFCLKHLSKLPTNWLVEELTHCWSASDPDDTDPSFLNLWDLALRQNGGEILYDRNPLTSEPPFKVYRGQMREDDPLGISWTTSPTVAKSFASGAGLRFPYKGVVIERLVTNKTKVYAYITGREEHELVLNPRTLSK